MIEILDEILAGTPKYRITDNNGNIIADNVTIEMITQIIQAGTPINKELFERFETDYSNQIACKMDLSNVYNVGILTTEPRTITTSFNDPSTWREESTTKISHTLSGFTILASKVYSDTNSLIKFVDGKSDTNAINDSYYLTFQRAVPWKLKRLNAYIRGEYGSGTYKQLRISLDTEFNTSGKYIAYSSDQQQTNIFDVNLDTAQTSFYMRSITGTNSTTTYDIRAYELYSITYETNCNIISYAYPYTIADGTVIRFRTPTNLDETIPTVLKIGNAEVNLNLRKANTNYEIIWNDESSINASLPISIKTGTISDGGTIPRTEGFLNYAYFVSPNSAGADSAESNSYEADGNGWSITCSVNQSSRVVTSKAVSKTRRDSSNEYTGITTKSATVNYIEIAWN